MHLKSRIAQNSSYFVALNNYNFHCNPQSSEMIVYCRKETNLYNPEFICPKNQLNSDILPERHETCPFQASRDQLHAPHA